nr:nitroreductase/quinone reductase family protein [Streptomyces phaeoluteigriseus]
MPLTGGYEPSKAQFVRDQVELYESSGGTEGTTLQDLPVVVLTTLGARSGKIRRIELSAAQLDRLNNLTPARASATTRRTWPPSTGDGGCRCAPSVRAAQVRAGEGLTPGEFLTRHTRSTRIRSPISLITEEAFSSCPRFSSS